MPQLFTYVCPLSMDRFQRIQGNDQATNNSGDQIVAHRHNIVYLFLIFNNL